MLRQILGKNVPWRVTSFSSPVQLVKRKRSYVTHQFGVRVKVLVTVQSVPADDTVAALEKIP